MGAASPGLYRVRIHKITDYTIEANVAHSEDLKGALLKIHEKEGLEGLTVSLEQQVPEGREDGIVGSYGLEVDPLTELVT